jgi:hypothetical protein
MGSKTAEWGSCFEQRVKRDSGASNEEIHHFFAEGMLLNVAAALELGSGPDTWSLSALLEKTGHASAPGGGS